MGKYASEVVSQAVAWLGLNESNGSHKKIVDVYNSHKPLARSYPLQYDDDWCAGFVSAVAIACGMTDIIPTEVSCNKMIDLFKKMGAWVEDESVTPESGWVCFYDWDDNATGKGDNMGSSDHVGFVETVSCGKFVTIEGNYSNAVKRRTMEVNGRYIRGYGVPKYDSEESTDPPLPNDSSSPAPHLTQTRSVTLPVLRRGSSGGYVKTLQHLLNAYNNAGLVVDGVFGAVTEKAVLAYQNARGIPVDGEVAAITWGKLLM